MPPTRGILLSGFPDRNEVSLRIGRNSLKIGEKSTGEFGLDVKADPRELLKIDL